MMQYILRLIILSLSFGCVASESALIKNCSGCHGEKGVSLRPDVPTIAGLSAPFLEANLYAYKDNQRPATVMKAIVEPLTEKQIIEVAQYFSAQRFIAAKQKFNPELVKTGGAIHQAQCARCHQNGGSLADDDAGILAGQWREYLATSIKTYRDASRQTERNMKLKLDQLSESEINALLAFYASQQ